MPHLTIEYSRNLRDDVGPQALVDTLHAAAIATGEFPPMSLRTRAVEREWYRVGDGHPDNGFVHIVLRIRPGREREKRTALGEALFAAAVVALTPTLETRPVGLTFEIQEIDITFRFLKNSMPDYWAKRPKPSETNGTS